jgi:multidrug efflux pump subunit AcrB
VLNRVEGVGDVMIFGAQGYSMRVWLDPDRLQSRNLAAGDVIRVLREQNVQVAAGQIGRPPVPKGQDFQYTLSTLGRLAEGHGGKNCSSAPHFLVPAAWNRPEKMFRKGLFMGSCTLRSTLEFVHREPLRGGGGLVY